MPALLAPYDRPRAVACAWSSTILGRVRQTALDGSGGFVGHRWLRLALLRGDGRVEPYEPHGVGLVEFGDGFS
jgi:hypothetical protein